MSSSTAALPRPAVLADSLPGAWARNAALGAAVGLFLPAYSEGRVVAFALLVVGGLSKAALATAVLPSAWALARKADGRSILDRRDG